MTEDLPEPSAPKKPTVADARRMRSAARLYAVQALFQMEAAGSPVDKVSREFETHRFGQAQDGVEMPEGHVDLFRKITSQAVNHQARIDQMTDRALVAKWPINRIDPTLRALFRVVIAEYLDIAEAFFPEGREKSFVNAVLDHMAREANPEAFPR
jgi:N utilization substance protein B